MASWGGRLSIFIGANTKEAEKKFNRLTYYIKGLRKNLDSAGQSFSVAFTVPITAIGAAATKVGLKFEDAMKTIRFGTGATGEALDTLKADFKAIAAQVPQSFGDSAKAIADLNTMTGASGKTLQSLAVATLDASRMLQTDLGGTISSLGKLMTNWNIQAADGVDILDKLFVASQSTGMGMDAIAQAVTNTGGAFRQMGVGLDESIALISSLDKAGIRGELSLRSLSRALAVMAKAGINDTSQALTGIVNGIKNAKTQSEATTRAVEFFGAMAGPKLAIAIREGKFEVNDLVGALQNAGGTIKQTSGEFEGFSERWGKMSNQLAIALEPLGTKILSIAEEYMPSLTEALEGVALSVDKGTIKMLAFAAAIGPILMYLGAVAGSVSSLISVFKVLAATLAGPVGLVVALSAAAIHFVDARREAKKLREESEKTASVMKWMGDRFNDISTASLEAQLRNLQLALTETRKQAALTLAETLKLSDANFSLKNGVFGGLGSTTALKSGFDELKEYDKQASEYIAKIEAIQTEIKRRGSKTGNTNKTGNAGTKIVKIVLPKLSGSKSAKSAQSSGKSDIEEYIENVQDRIKYLNEDGFTFLPTIEAMRDRLKPLSDDWKKLEDLRIEIDTNAFSKSVQNIQDQMKYLGREGSEFLPQLEGMAKKLEPLSEKGKQVADVMRNIVDSMYSEKWNIYAWNFSEGLLKGTEYAEILQNEINGLAKGTEKWRARFSELQSVQSAEVGKLLESLSRELDIGKIQGSEYENALEGIIEQFKDLPRVVQQASEALEEFRRQQETVFQTTGQQLSAALKEVTKDFRELQGQGILGTVEGFLQAAIYGEDFGQSLKKLGQDIVYTTLKMAILGQLSQWLGGVFGGMGGTSVPVATQVLPSAKGNVFVNGMIRPYRDGGIVNMPTVFPMANGMGLMGEAGPEAIMPLKRNSSGQLGVAASGVAPTVIVNIENKTSVPVTAEQSSSSFDEQFSRAVVSVVLRDQAQNGPITRNFRRR